MSLLLAFIALWLLFSMAMFALVARRAWPETHSLGQGRPLARERVGAASALETVSQIFISGRVGASPLFAAAIVGAQ
jgi:hypothetical protein